MYICVRMVSVCCGFDGNIQPDHNYHVTEVHFVCTHVFPMFQKPEFLPWLEYWLHINIVSVAGVPAITRGIIPLALFLFVNWHPHRVSAQMQLHDPVRSHCSLNVRNRLWDCVQGDKMALVHLLSSCLVCFKESTQISSVLHNGLELRFIDQLTTKEWSPWSLIIWCNRFITERRLIWNDANSLNFSI